jgi:imidazoleglycerol-phosphate dehydratase
MSSSSTASARTAKISRKTNETKVAVIVGLDGGEIDMPEAREGGRHHARQMTSAQQIDIDTGIGFLDHMLHQLAKHGGWSLFLRCEGDLHSTAPVEVRWHS